MANVVKDGYLLPALFLTAPAESSVNLNNCVQVQGQVQATANSQASGTKTTAARANINTQHSNTTIQGLRKATYLGRRSTHGKDLIISATRVARNIGEFFRI
jgi:uncharacterized Zn-binding protein involved in type VI secretion